MDREELLRRVCEANRAIYESGLVVLTFGNVSAREGDLVAIKPSGVEFRDLNPSKIPLISLLDGKVVESELKPSVDTPTHLEIYRAFPDVNAVVHTHSPYATAFAQARKPISCYGTTHADHFMGEVPVADLLSEREVAIDYEANTGRSIVKKFNEIRIDPLAVPACLVPFHGAFVWGKSLREAVTNATVLEQAAMMAMNTRRLDLLAEPAPEYLVRSHFSRKHGPQRRYGQ